jgi:hypothetical protein
MKYFLNSRSILAVLFVSAFVLTFSLPAFGQKTLKITGNARGTSTQLGQIVSIDLWVREYSDKDERAALMEAFKEKGSEGLANALEKLKSKGRIAITGTLGFDVNYIKSFKKEDGSEVIRFVTDRPITFAENWASTRSRDYQISMGEIVIRKEKGKSTGTIWPVAKLKLNKNNELEIETFQNPWELTNIRVSK